MGSGVINIDVLVELVKASNSWDDFKNNVENWSKLSSLTVINEEPKEEELSDFNKKLKQGLEWNPKEHKKKK
ncbi:hypothetical protein [Flavobacterium sp. AG291]|uniref:hypothetical protein n=1 Tax=Flavobacterium sp. AG291 TaxID=2184000 RepID=UPI000E0C3A26|nr:hypothetical protein [Flavobacterium sp. AG291]RDI13216.1 hypothetical protein DEU42_103126 [Flavobacterium sp. AG291]